MSQNSLEPTETIKGPSSRNDSDSDSGKDITSGDKGPKNTSHQDNNLANGEQQNGSKIDQKPTQRQKPKEKGESKLYKIILNAGFEMAGGSTEISLPRDMDYDEGRQKEFILGQLEEIQADQYGKQNQGNDWKFPFLNSNTSKNSNANNENQNQEEELKKKESQEKIDIEKWQTYFKNHREDKDMPQEYKRKFLDKKLLDMVQNDRVKGYTIKGVFKGSEFGRYFDRVSYKKDTEILIARHFCPGQGLFLTLLRKKEQKPEIEEEEYLQDKFCISNYDNGQCKDASMISYVYNRNKLIFYQRSEAGGKMILTAIKIRTGKPATTPDLAPFNIEFDPKDLQIHSVIFNQDHIGKQPEGKTGTENFLKSLYVGVIFTRTDEEKIRLSILKLGNAGPGFSFKSEEKDDPQCRILIDDVTEQGSSFKDYTQNNIKIKVLDFPEPQPENNSTKATRILVSHGIVKESTKAGGGGSMGLGAECTVEVFQEDGTKFQIWDQKPITDDKINQEIKDLKALVKLETEAKCILSKGDGKTERLPINEQFEDFTKQLVYKFKLKEQTLQVESMNNKKETKAGAHILKIEESHDQGVIDVLFHSRPGFQDTWTLIVADGSNDSKSVKVEGLVNPEPNGLQLPIPFSLTFSSPKGVSVVELHENSGNQHLILGRSKKGDGDKEDVKVTAQKNGNITHTDKYRKTWYLIEKEGYIYFTKKQNDASKFVLEGGQILRGDKRKAVAIGPNESFIKSMQWENEQKHSGGDFYSKDVDERHMLITSTSLTALNNQCSITCISGFNNQDITVLTANLNATQDLKDSYQPNEYEFTESAIPASLQIRSKYIKNIVMNRENGDLELYDEKRQKQKTFQGEGCTLALRFQDVVPAQKNETPLGFCNLSNEKIRKSKEEGGRGIKCKKIGIKDKIDKKLIHYCLSVENEKQGGHGEGKSTNHYIKIYHTEVEGDSIKLTGCSTLIGLNHSFGEIQPLYDSHSHQCVGTQISSTNQKANSPKIGIRNLTDKQFQVKKDNFISVGYEVIQFNDVQLIRFDIIFSKQSSFHFFPPKSQLEILTRYQQIFMNMDLFDFGTILKDKFIPEDIFQLSEALNMQWGCEYFLMTPKRLRDDEDSAADPKTESSNSIYDQLTWIEDHGNKREMYGICLNFDLESPLDRCIELEESEEPLEVLTPRLMKMDRSKESNAILMSNLQRSISNKGFSKYLVEFLTDQKVLEGIGEAETKFTKNKIAWHLEDFSNYAENLPNINQYPPPMSFYKRFINFYVSQLNSRLVLPRWILGPIWVGRLGLGISLIVLKDMFDGCQIVGSIMIVQSPLLLVLVIQYNKNPKLVQVYALQILNLGMMCISIVLLAQSSLIITLTGLILLIIAISSLAFVGTAHPENGYQANESDIFTDYERISENLKGELNDKIMKETKSDSSFYSKFISELKEIKKTYGYGNNKQKGTFSFIDFTAYKIAREIESQKLSGKRAGDFTHLDVALISKGVTQQYLGDTKSMKTIRSIIDYQYKIYTSKVQMFEVTLVAIQIITMAMRLFYQKFNPGKFSFIQSFGQFVCPILMFALELAQLNSLGFIEMYFKWSLKFLTDFVYPIGAFVYFLQFRNLELKDYDSYENQQNAANILQDIIDEVDFEKIDNIFHNKMLSEESASDIVSEMHDDQKNEYIVFVFYTLFLCALIFMKFKNQLQMSKSMNSVIQLIELSLSDATYFLLYYFFLVVFFCVMFMVQGSVISSDDYGGLDDDTTTRYPYYLIQNFRNSIGDLMTPSYQFWIDFGGIWSKAMIFIIWLTWAVNIIFCSLLMLNFLITVFSETHERVLTNAINYSYLTRAQMNVECLGMLKTIKCLTDFDYIVICSPDDETEDGVESLGVITCITQVIQEHSLKLGKQIKSENTQMKKEIIDQVSAVKKNVDTERTDVNIKVKKVFTKMSAMSRKVDTEMNDVNNKVKKVFTKMKSQNAEMKAEMSDLKDTVGKILRLVEVEAKKQ